MTLVSLLQAGVRFTTARPDGTPGHTLSVSGPPALAEQVKACVAERVALLADGLSAARAKVWREWRGPVAAREGKHKDGRVWRAEVLPEGSCETCAGDVAVVRDGHVVVSGSGMCALCQLAYQLVLAKRATAEAA